MDSPVIDNHSKASDFSKFKRLLYKYYRRFSKISEVNEHLNKLLVVLYVWVP